MKSAVIKRSVIIKGRKTSISLENEFWDALRQVAKQSNVPVPKLLAEIDQSRTTINLSSAIRIFLLNLFRAQNADRLPVVRTPWFLIDDGEAKEQTETPLEFDPVRGTSAD